MRQLRRDQTPGSRNALAAAVRLGCLYIAVASWLGVPTSLFVGQHMQAIGASSRQQSRVTLEARRPPSPYNLFVKAKFAEKGFKAKAEKEGITPMALCAQEWKAVTPDVKADFEQQAEAAKVGFVPDPPKRKKRTSGYGLFMKRAAEDEDFMASLGGKSFISEASALWKDFSEEEKAEWNEEAADLPAPKPPKTKKKKLSVSGYNLFTKALRDDAAFMKTIPAGSPGTVFIKEAAAKWKEATAATKQKYKDEAAMITAERKAAAEAEAEE